MKTTKTIIFFNQNNNKGMPSSKSRSWNKKNKNKNMTSVNKEPTIFYCKKETEQSYDKKTYLKLVLNKREVIENSTSIYTPWAPNSRKIFKKLPIYMWPMCTHVWITNELIFNLKWTKTQLRVNLNLTKSELRMNYELKVN